MQFVRKPFLFLLGSLLPFLLFATAFSYGVVKVIGEPEPVKKILADSGLYGSVVSSTLDQAKKSSAGTSEVTLTDPAIKKAAEESFSPQVIQDSSEKAIDGIYGWLEGRTETPNFNIDLSGVKISFAEKVGQAARDKAASLPICTSIPASTDPFTATCLPPGLTPAQVGEQAKQDVLRGQGFLENPNIKAESIKNSGETGSVFDTQFKDAPERFQTIKKAPLILTILAILTALAIIFLSATRKHGLRRVGTALAVVGALMLVFNWGLRRAVADNVVSKINVDNAVLQSSVQKLITDIVNMINQNYLLFGIIYLGLGAAAIIASIFMGRHAEKTASHPTNDPKLPPKPKENPRPKSPPKVMG